MTEKRFEIYDADDWELISQYIRLIIEASNLPKWGHYEFIDIDNPFKTTDTYKDSDNIYHRTSKQLEKHLKDNGFLVDTVSRSSVGDLSFYDVKINLSDDEWEYEKTNDLEMRKLLGIRNVGLVDFHKQDGMVHEVILVSVKELNDKYLKDGNLVFNNGDGE